MILTVFVSDSSSRAQWQARLFEESWRVAGQPGRLQRLVAQQPGVQLPPHCQARVEQVLPWRQHPYMADNYAGYDLPAALFEWLLRSRIDATILLMDSASMLCKPIAQEVKPGTAMAARWEGKPEGKGPFGLPGHYQDLAAYCVNRDLELPRVQLPVLIHSQDLLRLAPRWLELTAIIRQSVTEQHGRPTDAVKLAYTIAAAEYEISHSPMAWLGEASDDDLERPVYSYEKPIESAEGRILFDALTDTPEADLDQQQAAAAVGRTILSRLAEHAEGRANGMSLGTLRPLRRPGVREGRVVDQLFLEIGSPPQSLNLNPSAAAIWDLCDGERTLFDIASELQSRFDIPMETMAGDVELAAMALRMDEAIELETVN